MSVFFFVGAWTLGRNVVTTLGQDLVTDPGVFTIETSIVVLFFIGGALFVGNYFGVPASTSMTAVGAIAGLGVASGQLNESVMLEIVAWWLVAPVLAFWVCAVIGRYLYVYLMAWFHVERAEGPIFEWSTAGPVRYPSGVHPGTSVTEVGTSVLVVAIGCYMAFSAGASNVANAVAPLVGSGSISTDFGILLAGGAIALGAFTIARRTLDTVGDDITELPILAALIVSIVGGTIITVLSALGIPASLAVSTTCCIIGLGWGRASRAVTVAELASPAPEKEPELDVATGALVTSRDEDVPTGPTVGDIARGETPPEKPDEEPPEVPQIGAKDPVEVDRKSLFDPSAVKRIALLWVLTPTLAVLGSYPLFLFVL